jgi:hypothetical protein
MINMSNIAWEPYAEYVYRNRFMNLLEVGMRGLEADCYISHPNVVHIRLFRYNHSLLKHSYKTWHVTLAQDTIKKTQEQ